MCVLVALMAGLFWWMKLRGHGYARPLPSVTRLGFRNASRHPVRSLLTVGLLAAAVFLVVAVQAFHRDPQRDFLSKYGGSGGYPWIGEATLPVFQDLNSATGRAALNLDKELKARFVPLRVQGGDDASCLNLYKARQPRVVGVPDSLIKQGGFRFAGIEQPSGELGLAIPDLNENRDFLFGKPKTKWAALEYPWELLLLKPYKGAIPAIGEANTVKYMFNSGLGKEITIRDGTGKDVRLRIVALLQDSVFQSELLVSEDNFLNSFHARKGFSFS